jgi:prephenate dehydratase
VFVKLQRFQQQQITNEQILTSQQNELQQCRHAIEEKQSSYDRLKQHSRDECRKLKEQQAHALAAIEQKTGDVVTKLKREVHEVHTREASLTREIEVELN